VPHSDSNLTWTVTGGSAGAAWGAAIWNLGTPDIILVNDFRSQIFELESLYYILVDIMATGYD
jgi:hypothetical protein